MTLQRNTTLADTMSTTTRYTHYRIYAGGEISNGYWCGVVRMEHVIKVAAQYIQPDSEASAVFEAHPGTEWSTMALEVGRGETTEEALFDVLHQLHKLYHARGPFLALPVSGVL